VFRARSCRCGHAERDFLAGHGRERIDRLAAPDEDPQGLEVQARQHDDILRLRIVRLPALDKGDIDTRFRVA
jgi:hypothetical protein